jgi:hypothetical protein
MPGLSSSKCKKIVALPTRNNAKIPSVILIFEERIMERVYRVRRQRLIENAVEVVLLGLCLTASIYGIVLLDTLPLSI